MREECIEGRLFWGADLEAVTYTALRPNAHVGEVRVADERGILVAPVIRLENELALHLAIVEKAAPLPRCVGDRRVALAVLAAAGFHAVLGAVAFHGRGATGDEEARAQSTMAAYLAAIDARTDATIENVPPQVAPPDGTGGGAAAKGSTGAAGNPAKTNDVGRAKHTKGAKYHATRNDEDDAVDVSTFGILAMIAADRRGDNAGSSPWAKDLGPAAMGNMFGATIDDAFGNGGLGLSGNGDGGGGRGKGVELSLDQLGLAGSGTCGDECTGSRGGYRAMRGVSVLKREHVAHYAWISGGGHPQVNGRLPPESIQRVVRASFGRFRGCYEKALQSNPNLEGRIAAKFVIARDGSVSMVSASETSMDASVTSCVERAFYNLSFAQPEGGIVTVVYPIVFSTSS